MKNLRKVLCAFFACILVFGLIAMPAMAEEEITEEVLAPELVIFPINQAQILAGAKFDFKVELNHIPAEPEEFTITVNDQDATAVFGEKKAKNVILMIGDGLGGSVRNAARMVSRPLVEGRYQSHLNMEDMDVMTMVTTSGMNSLVTDSANSASAYATGHKTSNNAIGVYTFNPNDEEQVAPKVENIIELTKQAGMSTGIIATSEIEDATPDKDQSQAFEDLGYTFVGTRTELNAVDTANTNQLLGLFHADREIEKNPDVLKAYNDQPGLVEMTQTALDILSKNENGF